VLDMVAGDYVGRELKCLADDGRLALIAVQGGVKSEIDAGLVLRKRLAITGSTLRPRPLAYKTELAHGPASPGLAADRGGRRQARDPPGVSRPPRPPQRMR
jgi:NADPH:quinone reductase-like Zn-dependent oxidoreductase